MSQNEHGRTAVSSRAPAISRREFTRRAAFASAATTLSPAILLPVAGGSAFPEGPLPALQDPTGKPKLSPEGLLELEARVQTIFARYGKRLSEEQKADIRRLQTLLQPQLESLRAYSLANSDPPALYLKPLVEREKTPAAKPVAGTKR